MASETKLSRFFEMAEDRVGKQAAFLLLWMAILWAVEIVDWVLPVQLDQFGIRPRDAGGLAGILLAPFLHGNFAHLASNTLSLFVLAWVVLATGWRRFWITSAVTVFGAGLVIWCFGRADSVHLGASVLVFGYLGFLLLQGVFRRSLSWIVVSVVVAVLYGGLLRGILPLRSGMVSWEGHLFGFLAGVLAAWMQRRAGEQLASRSRVNA